MRRPFRRTERRHREKLPLFALQDLGLGSDPSVVAVLALAAFVAEVFGENAVQLLVIRRNDGALESGAERAFELVEARLLAYVVAFESIAADHEALFGHAHFHG